MGLERLARTIISSAEEDAAKIISEAKEAASRIRAEQEKEIKELEKSHEKRLGDEIQMMERRMMSSVNLDVKKQILSAKKEMVETVLEKARESISKGIAEKERERVIARLLKKAGDEIEIGTIQCNRKDMSAVKRLARGVKVAEKGIIGGIIAVSSDNRTIVDYSFDAMLNDIGSRELSRISELLFG